MLLHVMPMYAELGNLRCSVGTCDANQCTVSYSWGALNKVLVLVMSMEAELN